MAEVDPVQTGDVLEISVWEAYGAHPPYVRILLQYPPDFAERIRTRALCESLSEASSLAEQAMWAWTSGGLIGLQAYLMSRPDKWIYSS